MFRRRIESIRPTSRTRDSFQTKSSTWEKRKSQRKIRLLYSSDDLFTDGFERTHHNTNTDFSEYPFQQTAPEFLLSLSIIFTDIFIPLFFFYSKWLHRSRQIEMNTHKWAREDYRSAIIWQDFVSIFCLFVREAEGGLPLPVGRKRKGVV